MNKARWIKNNIQMIKAGINNGSFSTCLIRDLEIYKGFINSSEPSLLIRYTNLSEQHSLSERSIRLIVTNMKKNI